MDLVTGLRGLARGEMAASLKDVARTVGVSVTTVSRALAGYPDVAEETRRRIQKAAEELGYQPHPTARRLRTKKTDTLGFILPTFAPRFTDPFFAEFIAGVGNKAAEHDYDLLVSTHSPDSEEERRAYARAVRGGWVDGLIVVRTRENDSRIRLLCERGFPFVAFGRTDDELEFPYVDEDGAYGINQLVQHFVELGHRRIAFIAPPSGLMFGRSRLRGFQEAMQRNHLDIPSGYIPEGDMTQRSGAEAAQKLLELELRPTAIIGGNDLMALGAISHLQKNGLKPGIEIAVAGFDDIPIAAYSNPPLTTIHQPIYDIGQMTCAMLIDILNARSLGDRHVLLKPDLVIRESSGTVLSTNSKGGDQ